MPNIAAPTTSGPSICICIGKAKLSANTGLGFFNTTKYPSVLTTTALPITNIKAGSQLRLMSRNPITFAGLLIPDTAKPKPNNRPENKAENRIAISTTPLGKQL